MSIGPLDAEVPAVSADYKSYAQSPAPKWATTDLINLSLLSYMWQAVSPTEMGWLLAAWEQFKGTKIEY